MTDKTSPSSVHDSILNQIEQLRKEFNERRAAQPPLTSSVQSAYELRMQQLYDQLDGSGEAFG